MAARTAGMARQVHGGGGVAAGARAQDRSDVRVELPEVRDGRARRCLHRGGRQQKPRHACAGQ